MILLTHYTGLEMHIYHVGQRAETVPPFSSTYLIAQ